MVEWVAPVVGRQVWRKERSCHGWDVSTQMRAKWTSTTSRAMARPSPRLRSPPVFGGQRGHPELSFEGALFKGGSNYGESEFFGLSSSVPNRSIQTKVGSTFRLFYNLAEFALRLVFRSA